MWSWLSERHQKDRDLEKEIPTVRLVFLAYGPASIPVKLYYTHGTGTGENVL